MHAKMDAKMQKCMQSKRWPTMGGDFRLPIQGVFLVSAKNAFVPVKRVHSVNRYSRMSAVKQGSERSE